ncbi:urease accessory protein UreF [Salinibacterium sp. SWN167]|uniref:urease accessory protein UreF n=1 Tax=Salinibacterium sp. SWN167 TaxID=2792054 RepID=UPI0018CF3CDE|nr:urease accessory UreF family protein [Salinibacterium sp. SWN167]MBH0083167.1 urease accessory protein [Salinibacterium sp. SWN167]
MVDSGTLAMLLADARLPTGGHTHSAGMEPALLGGLQRDDIPSFLAGKTRSTTLVEAGTAVVARHQFISEASPSEIDALIAAWAARTPSPALRDASRLLGRGYTRIGRTVWPHSASIAFCAQLKQPPRAVVLGAIAATTQMKPADLVRLVVYEEVQNAASAVLKLDPIDPATVVTWVLNACEAAEPFIDQLSLITTPEAIPALGAPQAEGWAEAHAVMKKRLFRA